jgi:hypothetical protein
VLSHVLIETIFNKRHQSYPAPLNDDKTDETRINSGGEWEWNRFCKIREEVEIWSDYLGGVECWGERLRPSFAEACKTPGGQERWVADILEHIEWGQELVQSLERMQGVLPNKAWQIRYLWQVEVQCLKTVLKGLAFLESRVNLNRPDSLNLMSALDIDELMGVHTGRTVDEDEEILEVEEETN